MKKNAAQPDGSGDVDDGEAGGEGERSEGGGGKNNRFEGRYYKLKTLIFS